jgi:beta-phosphoglucomutase-like phosphatase (HAD superfamily)
MDCACTFTSGVDVQFPPTVAHAQTAVAAYLTDSGLSASVDYVSARSVPDPVLMKPNPYLVRKAVSALNAKRESSALVGDQVSDVIAAHRAGVRAVGYANKSGKVDRFKEASADLIVTSMAELFVHV